MAEHINGPLYWEQLGKQGQPIAFIHPNPLDHSCWLYQMAHFSTWYRCVGIDLPGYGKSPRAAPGLTIADLARASWEVLDEVASEPAILVGLSTGWHTVMHMAQQQPIRTRAIIMSGCSYRGSAPKPYAGPHIAGYSERGLAARHAHVLNDYSPGFRETDMGRYFASIFLERNPWADAASIIEIYHALEPPDPDWLFEGITAPVLIITGSEDNSHQGAFALQKQIPGCELVTVEGAGHACNMEKPWDWDGHALRFLAKHGLFDGRAAALDR